MSTLSPMSCFQKKRSVAPRVMRRDCRRANAFDVYTDDESSDEDIGDDWGRGGSDQENDNDSVDVSWYVNDSESSDDGDDMIDDSWRERMEYF